MPEENVSGGGAPVEGEAVESSFSLSSISSIPCLFDSVTVSLATATAFAGHGYRKHRSILRTADVGVAVLCASGILTWSVCRLQKLKLENEEKKELVAALKKMTEEHKR